jgi:hypothetical protein
LTKGKGIRIEDRTISGHSLGDLGNFPKNTEVREKDFIFVLSGGNDIFEKHIKMISSKNISKSTDVLEKFIKYVSQSASLILYLQYKNYMKISRKS